MASLRQEKLNALFKKLISQFLNRNIEGALITITACSVSKDVKNARVFVLIYPEERADAVISTIRKQQKELREFLKQSTRMKTIPYATFSIDIGEKKRQRIDELLNT